MALVGFMASGKSTIGRKLARRLGAPFFDTDALIVREHGPIAAIFADEGEAAFRRYERAAIGEALESAQAGIVALGGGAMTEPENRNLLKDRAYRVFIKVPPEQILARVRRSREVRPMLGASPTLARIKELYAKRLPDYASSDRVIEAERRSDRDVIDEIVEWLAQERAL
ncbi:MAG TPA: shikimate kinase [Candidatus Acidoferrales bacterium]|nr:shikimate kinase [Candidatus Acidoferrales bacterium]